ncbi:MAG: adenylate cyclase [Parasphingorhabdus sp.]|jgi:adenylate cyclase
MGVNLGDVVVDGDDLLGDGVNVAARIEALAEPGGICISRSVRDQVRDRLDVSLTDLGETEVKNISRPVRIFQVSESALPDATKRSVKYRYLNMTTAGILLSVVLIAGGYWLWQSQQTDFQPVQPEQMELTLPDKPSVAVMPFKFIGSSEDEGVFLTDGLSENISAHLTAIGELFVIGNQSTRSLSNQSIDVRGVAIEFGVQFVLTGSLQKVGDSLRVTASLVDAVVGNQIWSGRYDRSQSDWFTIQDEITLAVVEKIYGKAISGEHPGQLSTRNLQAFIAGVKGKFEQSIFMPEGNEKARELYEQALQLDPNIAKAYGGISFSHLMDTRMGYAKDPLHSLDLSEEYARKLLKLDEHDYHAYRMLAMIRVVQKIPDEAIEFVEKVLAKGDGDADVVGASAWVYKYVGKSEQSLDYFSRAKRLQPVHGWWLVADEFGALIDAQQYDRAFTFIDAYLAAAPKGFEEMF